MSHGQAMRHVVVPQAVTKIPAPMLNELISLLKDTALVSVVAAPEIMFFARNLVTETLQSMHIYLMAAVLYLCMTIPLSRFVAALERARRAWH